MYCDACGQDAATGDHARCRARRAATDPPRYCTACARKLVVQVLPRGYTARCVKCGPITETSEDAATTEGRRRHVAGSPPDPSEIPPVFPSGIGRRPARSAPPSPGASVSRGLLDELRAAGLLRELRTIDSASGPHVSLDGRDVLLLCSNDYLGLAGDPRVRAAAAEAAQRWGAGAGSSRLVSGGLAIHDALEEELADYLGTETALLVGSGYLANLAAVTALTEPGERIHSDALNHASIVDACRLSRAETVVYPHLTVPEGATTVVTDEVFSMDGDVADLQALAATGARLIIDTAHSTGVRLWGVSPLSHVVVGTLSKALGSYGAFIGCDRDTRALLVNRARPIIYSTALPPAAVGAARAALEIVRTEPQRMERLHANARVLREAVGAPVSDMPIVPLIVGDPDTAMAVTAQALERGVFAQAIRPPTVPDGTSRLRLVARADHEPDELREAGAMLAECVSSALSRPSRSGASTG